MPGRSSRERWPVWYVETFLTDRRLFNWETSTRRADQIGHDLDNLSPSLPLWDVAQDLYNTDPTQETCPTVDHAEYTAPTRQCELDHTDQGSICPDRSRSCRANRWSVRCAGTFFLTFVVPNNHRTAIVKLSLGSCAEGYLHLLGTCVCRDFLFEPKQTPVRICFLPEIAPRSVVDFRLRRSRKGSFFCGGVYIAVVLRRNVVVIVIRT